MDYEWDEIKARANLRVHGVDFDESITVFSDPLTITIPDPEHSVDEERYIDLGYSTRGRLLVVVYTERQNLIRIISSRRATRTERVMYERNDA
jgi:uncharacterized DUF497 family protein